MKKFFIMAIMAQIFVSCQKRYDLEPIDSFGVQTTKTAYAVGDTVTFLLAGNADNIVYWSGENGHNYYYRNRTYTEGNTIKLNFKSYSQYGTVDKTNIKLLVSTDFTGTYTAPNVSAATWSDISDRAIWSSGADQTPSGEISLDDFASKNKNMVVAFQFKTSAIKNSATQNRWVIRSFDLTSTNNASEVATIFNMSTAGWASFNFSASATDWTISSSQLYTGRSYTELDDDWVLTRQFNPNAAKPDLGVAIKNIAQGLSEYKAVFSKVGKYKVVFVATNANLKRQTSKLKELELTITN